LLLTLLGLPAFLIKTEAGGFVVAAAELADLVRYVQDHSASVGVAESLGDGGVEAATEGDGEGGGEPIGRGGDIDDRLEISGLLAGVLEPIAGFLEVNPFDEAALPPFGEVLLVDRAAFEFLVQELADFREGVEPLNELGSLLAVLKAEVEVLAQGVRETGDFSSAGHTLRSSSINLVGALEYT
jgi:hypothetical protein